MWGVDVAVKYVKDFAYRLSVASTVPLNWTKVPLTSKSLECPYSSEMVSQACFDAIEQLEE